MIVRNLPAMAIALLALIAVSPVARSEAPKGVKALDGEWVYVEDRTEGRPKEQQGPNMGPRIRMRVEKDAVVIVRSDGEIRMPLDGKPTDIARSFGTSRYHGEWKDGSYVYESVPVRDGQPAAKGVIRWKLTVTAEGMLASVSIDAPAGKESVCLFRHPKDIELPKPAKSVIGDISWLAGAWVGSGSAGTRTFEERWSPPGGGAMLAVSRTISREKMVAFEFLRIVERDGGLVYIAQPGGRTPTEFTLTELSKTRAVFENPRHDSPQRIVYERSAEGGLTASIGFMKGGIPRRFEFKKEGEK